MAKLSTLIYLEADDCYLMMHRNKKANDISRGKWIGVGGKFEAGETPLECARREVLEETGQAMVTAVFRGVITFVYADAAPEYIFLFTGTLADTCVNDATHEGELHWIPKADIFGLHLWAGDCVFLERLIKTDEVMDIKLVYDSNDQLTAVEEYA